MPRSAALCALLCGPVRHSSVAQYAMLTSTVLVKFSLLCTDEVMNFYTALRSCVPRSLAPCAALNF